MILPKHKPEWITSGVAMELYNVPKNTLAVKKANGYGVEHYYKARKGNAGALIDIGYLKYIRELNMLAQELIQQFVYVVDDSGIARKDFALEIAKVNETTWNAVYVYMHIHVWNSATDRRLTYTRVSERAIDMLRHGWKTYKEMIGDETFREDYSDSCINDMARLADILEFEFKRLNLKSARVRNEYTKAS